MYAAHAEQKRREASRLNLNECLALVEKSTSDSERFSVLLEITQHVRENSFTEEDRRIVLQAFGVHFLTRLIITTSGPECSPLLYKSIALSLFSALSIDQYVQTQPQVKDLLWVVNSAIETNSNFKQVQLLNTNEFYKSICKDCEEIVLNLAQNPTSIEYLLECGTANILLNYVTSADCQNSTTVLTCLSLIVKNKGDGIFVNNPELFHNLMDLTVDRLGQGSDLREKTECANILTSFLNGTSNIVVSTQLDWVVKLLKILKKFITLKLSPDDSDTVLFLVCALVSAVGGEVLNPQLVGDATFLKAVVARLSVEVYMLLDCIDVNSVSAFERYIKLDKVNKLLCDVIHYLAEFGDSMDTDSIIAVYRKLVETSETIMEFLCSVWSQEVELPKNHSVVLICVRTLAAMLSEITEEPTAKLLELLPFFNFLCQNVEYTEDVVMEVKNATLAALENIKLMGISTIPEEKGDDLPPLLTSKNVQSSAPHQCTTENITGSNININNTSEIPYKDSATMPDRKDTTDITDPLRQTDTNNVESWKNNSLQDDATYKGHQSMSMDQSENSHQETAHTSRDPIKTSVNGNVQLTATDIEDFVAYQEAVSEARSKPPPFISRKVSFSAKAKKKVVEDPESEEDQSFYWKPLPDDVLGYLLPAYGFLLSSQEALEVMVRSDSFQSIISFLERSLSQLLESKSTTCPESMTINALNVIEQVYTNSPITAANLQCFQSLFEISVLSVPNLLTLPHPPPLVCLKLIEVCLVAYRLQTRENKRNSSLQRLKHSRFRLFKAVVEYLSTFYEFRQSSKRASMISIRKEVRDIWPLSEEFWGGCIAGLCTLIRCVEEVQDVLVSSLLIPDFLAFLQTVEDKDLNNWPENVQKIAESLITLAECAAEGSTELCELICQNHGKNIAKKFSLKKLERCLLKHEEQKK
ncbi:unnamed protein product [Lymnaea stagnalis]|uniref:Uncharacterized protein n=1 Tax=Lymnaea stagnalis TaxID=6523 RepID=A0AAV2IJQ1_LYMST